MVTDLHTAPIPRSGFVLPPIAAFPERFFHKEKRRLMEAFLAQKIGVSFAAGFYPSLAVSEL
ncbi:hypothetical protein HK13_10105 [Acetobacter indonesiensis]|nr:hypothetical protein HK13_10105 [Acetobacter indonesiensis]